MLLKANKKQICRTELFQVSAWQKRQQELADICHQLHSPSDTKSEFQNIVSYSYCSSNANCD